MSDDIKSGKQILEEYFNEIKEIEGLNEEVVEGITELYQSGKMSDKNISNMLLELREKPSNE